MLKKIISGFCLLILVCATLFWAEFIKAKPVNGMTNICLISNKHFKIEIEESAKYIASVDTVVLKDTIELTVKSTTILNPFADKTASKIIMLKPGVKYIKTIDKVIAIDSIGKCHF